MIDFIEGGLQDIWPDKSPEIQALSYAIQNALKMVAQKADAAMIYAAVDGLPENILDYLAAELRAMYYEDTLEIDQKRTIVKNTLKWYMRAGTPATVEEMSEVIFGVGKVVEWPDFEEPPYTPGTFDIKTSAILTPDIVDHLSIMLRKAKNTRSHLRRVTIERESHAGAVAAIYQICTQKTVALNYIMLDQKSEAPFHAAEVGTTMESTYALNDIQQNTEAGLHQNMAFYGSATAEHTVATNETAGNGKATVTLYAAAADGMISRKTVVVIDEMTAGYTLASGGNKNMQTKQKPIREEKGNVNLESK